MGHIGLSKGNPFGVSMEARLVIMFIALGLYTVQTNVCPPEYETNIQGAFGWSGNKAYLQEGIWHAISCPTFRTGEELDAVLWYKGSDINDPSKVFLMSRNFLIGTHKDTAASMRYALSPDVSLIIKGVEPTDKGRYLCQVVPTKTIYRHRAVDLDVFDNSFPARVSEASSSAVIQGGRRQTLPCQCASQSPDAPSVVYWSMGEGVTTDTEIIGARFSDGVTLQIQHGADYSIGSDASLTVNSLNDVHDNQRFWCHVFQSDETLRNCYTDIEIKDGLNPSGDALRASETSFYLQKGLRQVLPCNWKPGTATCAIQWLKIDTSDRLLLSYNLSTNQVEADTGFNLTSDFGLAIASTERDHAGKYKCSVVYTESVAEIEVRVIGDNFPLDDGRPISGVSETFEPGKEMTLACLARPNISVNEAIVFWSFGKPDKKTATFIGKLNLPEGTKKLSDLGDRGCFDITPEGSLILNNCFQDGDVRYWCHVFYEKHDLVRSYQDLVTKDPSFVVVVALVCSCIPVVIVAALCVLCWRRKPRPHLRQGQRPTGYESIQLEGHDDSDSNIDVAPLVEKIKSLVKREMSRLPVTPWTWDDVDKAEMDDVYTPPDLFANVHMQGGWLRYKLDSESELFTDGISKLASNHVLIQGVSGSGKTTFLHKVATDWALGREQALLGRKKCVFVLPAKILGTAKSLGEAVAQYLLPKGEDFSAKLINEYCSHNARDVATLVDGCENKKDIQLVLVTIKDQISSGMHVVMTTRDTGLADEMCLKENLRYVILAGFSKENAEFYVKQLLVKSKTATRTQIGSKSSNTINVRSQSTDRDIIENKKPENEDGSNVDKARQSGETSPLITTEEQSLSGIKDAKISECSDKSLKRQTSKTGEPSQDQFAYMDHKQDSDNDNGRSHADKLEKAPTSPRTEGSQQSHYPIDVYSTLNYGDVFHKLVEYVKVDFPTPDVACLPLYLSVFCRLSFWTNGIAFQDGASSGVLFLRLLKCIVDKGKSDPLPRNHDGIKTAFSREQLGVIDKLGQVVVGNMEDLEQPTAFKDADFVESGRGRKNVLDMAEQVGLLCPVQVIPEKSCEHSEQGDIVPSIPGDGAATFVLEALQELCAGIHLNQNSESRSSLVRKMLSKKLCDQKLNNIVLFASQTKDCAKSTLSEMKSELAKSPPAPNAFTDVLKHQKTVELAMKLIFESKLDCASQKKLHFVCVSGNLRLMGISSHKIKLLSYFLMQVDSSTLKSIELFHVGKHTWTELEEYFDHFAPGVLDKVRKLYNKDRDTKLDPETSKQLRGRIASCCKDMPEFPSDWSDDNILHTVQSSGLQELLESQSGECHSSSASSELTQSLHRHSKLESLVLIGTILSSNDMVTLFDKMNKLKNIRKLDFRLNKEFDDEAFFKVAKALNGCETLTDLRLSLYKVTLKGFDKVQKEISTWGRLETLYLLHGSPAEKFVGFLSETLGHLCGITCLHISCLHPPEKLTETTADTFRSTMEKSNIVPSLKELVIVNIEELKEWCESLRLPKMTQASSLKVRPADQTLTQTDKDDQRLYETGVDTQTLPYMCSMQ
ncbi:uncharacterized protein LOC110975450 isoform X2 [Acanthaster planci]|uniref:Uncharacterized protein LOC110975450 isoform X2 n=1 Tax=Acanthaster planci TaxID=133434 RepID=A0A8B7XUG4_ACAPL|nr:uncharacterized protein LOC110975450 isoform X2 [Acanthaster planci]